MLEALMSFIDIQNKMEVTHRIGIYPGSYWASTDIQAIFLIPLRNSREC